MIDKDTGRFVWYELMTTDSNAAVAFYGETVGWKTQSLGEGGDYRLWVASQGPLGAVMTLPEAAKVTGAPPRWISNVTVSDVDATCAKIKELGGRVDKEPKSIPDVGRFAVIADPQGASIAILTPARPTAPHDTQKHGEYCWGELSTTDRPGALAFYQAIFGWEHQLDVDMGSMGTYTLFGHDGKHLGGIFQNPAGKPVPTAWLYYIQVDDLDAAVSRAQNNGAKLLNGPMAVPGGARIAQFMDPQGATFALHQSP